MSYLLQISAIQPPFSIDEDDNNRVMISCNYTTLKYNPNTNILSDISAIIVTSAIVPSTRILLGSRPVAPPPTSSAIANPSLDAPLVRIIQSGGYPTLTARGGSSASRGERPSIQVIVFSLSSQLASSVADSIFRLLDGKRHTIV